MEYSERLLNIMVGSICSERECFSTVVIQALREYADSLEDRESNPNVDNSRYDLGGDAQVFTSTNGAKVKVIAGSMSIEPSTKEGERMKNSRTKISDLELVEFATVMSDYENDVSIFAKGFDPGTREQYRFIMGIIDKNDLPKLIEVLRDRQKILEK